MNKEDMKIEGLAENLIYMRTAIEKTRRDFDPGIGIYITWGILCLIGFTATHFLIASDACEKIKMVWLGVYAIGIPSSTIFGYRLYKKQRTGGFVPYIYVQIGWIWVITVVSGIIFGTFGIGRFISDINYLWAWIYGISICMIGVVYSKEWVAGGILIFAGMIAAGYVREYYCLILGITMFGGCVIPSLITYRRLRKARENRDVKG